MTTASAAIPTAVLLLTLPLLYFFLAPHILRPPRVPITAPDELDDLSLFHKAIHMDRQHNTAAASAAPHHLPSRRSRFSTNPNPRPPKIAFMFLTNSALHFQPLWIRFFDGAPTRNYNIYVHSDPFAAQPVLEGPFKGKIIPSKRTQRSSPTLISAGRRLLATAMLDDPSNQYFALISQYCIPLHSFNFLYNFLFDIRKSGEFKSYIEILDHERTLRDRYDARGENTLLPEVKFEEFRAGSQFFVLTRKHGLMVIEDTKLWRKFKLPCLKLDSCYPEEHYFPTLLSMRDVDGCTKYTLTRVDWKGSVNGHPYTYRPGEVSGGLIRGLRRSNSSGFEYIFARKFSPDCLSPLMEIADSVILKDY